MKFLIVTLALMSASVPAWADELDNESSVSNQQVRAARNLPQTVVLRRHSVTNAYEVLHENSALPANATSASSIAERTFTEISANGSIRGELDRESSTGGWYFCFNYYDYARPVFYYYGYSYSYRPYYFYNYGPYVYYYFRWWWW